MPEHLSKNVLSWASDLDGQTRAQAERTASLPFVEKPLALMADAHLGMGATVGSVIATEGAIIPSAVGVDIGCGVGQMLAACKEEFPDSQWTKTTIHMHLQQGKSTFNLLSAKPAWFMWLPVGTLRTLIKHIKANLCLQCN